MEMDSAWCCCSLVRNSQATLCRVSRLGTGQVARRPGRLEEMVHSLTEVVIQ